MSAVTFSLFHDKVYIEDRAWPPLLWISLNLLIEAKRAAMVSAVVLGEDGQDLRITAENGTALYRATGNKHTEGHSVEYSLVEGSPIKERKR